MEKACGLDVHKSSVFACIMNEKGEKNFEKRYGTLTPDWVELRDMLVEQNCSRVKKLWLTRFLPTLFQFHIFVVNE